MTTTNKALVQPANGSDVGTWDIPINANASTIDTALGGLSTLNSTGLSGVVVLTLAQYTPANLVVTGTPAGAITYQLPIGVGGFFFVEVGTSGPNTISFGSASGGAVVNVPQGDTATVVIDPVFGARLADTIPQPAAGTTGQIQYNSGGAFAANSGLFYNAATQSLDVAGGVICNGNLFVGESVQSPLNVQGGAATVTVPVAFAAVGMVLNTNLSNVFSTTLTASVTGAPSLTNPTDGQTCNWMIVQDGAGNRTMTWPPNFRWVAGARGVLSTAPGSVDLWVGTYIASRAVWLSSLLNGFA